MFASFRRSALVLLIGVATFLCVMLVGAEAFSGEVDIHWGERITLRDGVELNATVYRPHDQTGPLPVIFTLTPYTADTYHERAWYFAQHGYVFALVDCRGRGNSEGEFNPFLQEPPDAYDAVEWFAQQPWCDGQVAMWGGSYAGTAQWMAAQEFPPHLKTIVPVASAYMGVDSPVIKNIFLPFRMQWLTLTSGLTRNVNLKNQGDYWVSVLYRMYVDHRPLVDLPEIAHNDSTVFDEWIAHPIRGPYWDQANPTEEDFARFDIPILTITGQYDGDQFGAMEYYRRHMQFGSEKGKANHYLIIGPWDHSGTRTPTRHYAGLDFGAASLLDMNDLHRQWYDWVMKDGPKPEFLKNRVAHYPLGRNEWTYVDSLEDVSSLSLRLYLNAGDGFANDVFRSGSLDKDIPPSGTLPSNYVHDPLDTRPGTMERNGQLLGITDQATALNLFGSGVVYHTAPFEEATQISGVMKLVTWMSMDVPDTDIQVVVYEISQDGSSVLLAFDAVRARYRESMYEEKLVTPGEIEPYTFEGFWFISQEIKKGSRLRLVIRGANTLLLEKNYNSGGVVAEESGADARTAHVTLYHDAEHPSYLELPIAD